MEQGGKKRIWTSFFLSLLLPIVGGLIVYLRKRREDNDLAKINLFVSILHPIILGYLIGFLIGVIFGLTGFDSSSNYLFIYITSILLAVLFNWFLIKNTFRQNQYRYFLPACYFYFLGAIYAYYGPYRDNKYLRKEMGNFSLSLILLIIIPVIIGGIISVWMMGIFSI